MDNDEQYKLGQQFYKIAMTIRNSWEDPAWLDKAFQYIGEIKVNFGNAPGWPLKVSPDKMLSFERLYDTLLSTRVDEISKLVDAGLFGEAAKLTNYNFVLHRDKINSYWGSKISGTENKLFNPALSEAFDTLWLHIKRLNNDSLAHLLPHTDMPTIKAKLLQLKTEF